MNLVWLFAAVVLFFLALYLFNMYRASHPNDLIATLAGVVLLLGVIAIVVWRGHAAWMDARSVYTEWNRPSLVQKEMDKLVPLGKFYDEKNLSEIPMAPIVGESGELEVTFPAILLSDSARSQVVGDVHKQMKVTEADSRFKDWEASVERVRYYFEGQKLVSYYVRSSLTAPDPADATKRIDKGFGSCTFRVSGPTYEKTLEFLRATRQSVTRKLQEAGFTDLPGQRRDAASVATTSPGAAETGDTVTSIPGTEGFSYEEPVDD
ncbi:MAG: hypothetical protein PHO92_02225 [Candidatus Peribacteraceae bacterium]|nr:hypothetical protein [Candidatus Peribacteraceae bacterium]